MVEKKEIIKLEEIQKKILEDIDKDSNVEAIALFHLLNVALEHDNFATELVIEKSVEIEGLKGPDPMVLTKWSVRQKTKHEV